MTVIAGGSIHQIQAALLPAFVRGLPTPSLNVASEALQSEACQRFLLHYGIEALVNGVVGAAAVKKLLVDRSGRPSEDSAWVSGFGLGVAHLAHEDAAPKQFIVPERFSASLRAVANSGMFVPETAFSDGLLFGDSGAKQGESTERRVAIAGENTLDVLFRLGEPKSFPASFLHREWQLSDLDNPAQAGGVFIFGERLWQECKRKLEGAGSPTSAVLEGLIGYYSQVFKELRQSLGGALAAGSSHLRSLLDSEISKEGPESRFDPANLAELKPPPVRSRGIPIPPPQKKSTPKDLDHVSPPRNRKEIPATEPKLSKVEAPIHPQDSRRAIKAALALVERNSGASRDAALDRILEMTTSDPTFSQELAEKQAFAGAVKAALLEINGVLDKFDNDNDVDTAMSQLGVFATDAYPAVVQRASEIAQGLVAPDLESGAGPLSCILTSQLHDIDSIFDTVLSGARGFQHAKVFLVGGGILEGVPLVGEGTNLVGFRVLNPVHESTYDIRYADVIKVEIWTRGSNK